MVTAFVSANTDHCVKWTNMDSTTVAYNHSICHHTRSCDSSSDLSSSACNQYDCNSNSNIPSSTCNHHHPNNYCDPSSIFPTPHIGPRNSDRTDTVSSHQTIPARIPGFPETRCRCSEIELREVSVPVDRVQTVRRPCHAPLSNTPLLPARP